jgi:hypothetical protein
MAAISTAAVVTVSLITPRTARHRLERFYHHVRPMGFWTRTARAAGDDPLAPLHRLRHRLVLAIVTAGAVYTALIGGAKLILPPPGRDVLEGGILLAASVVLSIIWIRGLEHEEELAPLPDPSDETEQTVPNEQFGDSIG